ncbi:hypothetical protein [Alkaliphilus peptidifermentans]|uniref:Uncharacterized protein n=1 Tax=Alkaliphilus peptidifermentans DSM 18978 TaxID=1120976 RepID=A0A1G5L2Y3_9FIRM|nr:hypothetical protein [Alkaliphilus peptidifermentans]SCZ06650.1 hypothetical protein SAMN03080606_03962 [Alkaliphilus peptidifermentans DSM 18978]
MKLKSKNKFILLLSLLLLITSLTMTMIYSNQDDSEDDSGPGGGSSIPGFHCVHHQPYVVRHDSHEVRCAVCNIRLENTPCQYVLTPIDSVYHSAICNICGNEKNVRHTLKYRKLNEGHQKVCGCGYEEEMENHNYMVTSIGDNKHNLECKVCQYKTSENHNWNNGKCTICNKQQPCNDHSLTLPVPYDESMHVYHCGTCNLEIGPYEHHSFVLFPNGVRVCEICGYEESFNHFDNRF